MYSRQLCLILGAQLLETLSTTSRNADIWFFYLKVAEFPPGKLSSGTNSHWKCLLRPSILCCLYQAMACGSNAQDFMFIPAWTRAQLVTVWAVWSWSPNGSTWAHKLHWELVVYLHVNYKIPLKSYFETASFFLFSYSYTQTFSAVSSRQRRL